jgi:Ser/Thr protein kinase RdoA (MazF antagonist)
MPEIGSLLGSGRVAETFAYGENALKLYREAGARAIAFAEAAVLAIVADHGLPTPAVLQAGNYAGRWGLVMSRAPGVALAKLVEADAGLVPAALATMVELHLAMHARVEPRLNPLKARLAPRIARAPGLDEPLRKRLLADLARLPDGDRLCHGDFHPFNIIGPPGSAMIVDWPDATSGPPAADACRSYLLMRPHIPQIAERYLDLYAERSGVGRTDILAWLPVLAAARLVENVAGEADWLLELANRRR